jgi:exodeoxyribonuclease V alpha subunit
MTTSAGVTNATPALNASDACDVVLGSRTSAYSKRMVTKTWREASEVERRSILSAPDKAKRYSWLLASSTNIARLRAKGAYSVSAFADDDVAKSKDNIELRDWVSRTFVCQPTSGTGDADPRDYFITWRIFHERQNLRYIYLPRSTIEQAVRVAGIGMTGAQMCLVDGPTDTRVVTHAEFAKMQASIRNFLRNATTLQNRPVKDFGVAGLDQHQSQVAKGIVATPFSVLHGGAGTGKSTLIAAVVNSFLTSGMPVLCLAPTHRAKKNLAKRLPSAANVTTVDSYIKSASASATKTMAGAGEKVFIFIDESSMVDLEKLALLARSRASSPGQWQICMTGDDGQLEPIARGEMFRTMIHNGGAHVFELLKCYRAENESLLEAQRAIRDGRVPEPSECVQISLLADDSAIEKALVPYIRTHQGGVQYIAWTNKMCGFVNAHVQKQVHGPRAPSKGYAVGVPITGDKVVYIGKNNVKKGLTNAMLGTVEDTDGSSLDVKWDDGGDVIACARSDVILAYCVTVHRAQGSQFEHVCVIATSVDAMVRALDRRWAYTAVSRAQRRCDIFSTTKFPDFVRKAVRKREMVGVNFNFKPSTPMAMFAASA